MKYLTKEWYYAMQKTDICLLLEVSREAEKFSEKYYNKLYKKAEKEWLKIEKECSKVKFEDIFTEYANVNELSEEQKKERDAALAKFNEGKKFDLVQKKEEFAKLQKSRVERLKSVLPNEILSKVPDIRVLALDKASENIKKLIKDFSMEQKRIEEKASNDYDEYNYKELKNSKDKVVQSIIYRSFHDSRISNIIKEKDKMIIEFNPSESYTDIKTIVFENYEIIEEDMDFKNGWWLYDELYLTDNMYEIHILLDTPSDKFPNLGYLTIKAKNIILNK